MSPENYKLMCEIAFKLFKEWKVEISDAIKTPFPFLEIFYDRGLITKEMYEESKTSWINQAPVQKVVYDVLNELEKKFDLSLLEILFSKVIVDKYPDLKGILRGFRNVILKKIFPQASVGDESAENCNIQLSIEQGTGENSYPRLSWLFPNLSDYTGTAPPDTRLSECLPGTEDIHMVDTIIISDDDALEPQQAIEQSAQVFEPVVTSSADSAERRNREEPPIASTSALRKPESMNLTKSSTPGNRPSKRGFMDLGNNSALQNPKKKRRSRQHPDASVNFRAEILRVACGEMRGLLIKRKLERGATRKCIRTEDGNWFTPREFEVRGGYQACNWKTSLTCSGKTLKKLIKDKHIRSPPITRESKKTVIITLY
ncbi:nuclear body protein SP140-like protein, partial [Phyllostomus hastatus]|uniref:nuclear body protein SP140-like protein n=1 Tax=Phyllostomus hastatus TaxID=9423 RepID=UPI001E6803CF